ncbi:S1C family serine protease [Nakamurella panacisegetis]|nr:trypsin-like peptidase domain-containing protein [Nakamurella panacisegetis]
MSSEDFPRTQDNGDSVTNSVPQPSADPAPTHQPDQADLGAVYAGAPAGTPIVVDAAGEASPPSVWIGQHRPEDGQDTGPVQTAWYEGSGAQNSPSSHGATPSSPNPPVPYSDQPEAPMWQPRPSGALSAEAWSAPSPTTAQPSTGAGTGSYPADQYGQYNQYGRSDRGYGQPDRSYGQSADPGQNYRGYPPAPLGYAGSAYPGSTGPAGATAVVPNRATQRKGTAWLVAAAMVVAIGGGVGGGYLAGRSSGSSAVADSSLTQQSTSPVVSDTQTVAAGSVEAVAAKMLPSVVSILSISSSAEGEGSGIILSSDGLILTNNHVIEGASELTVKFNDGTTKSATVVGSDTTDDLAVIKVAGVSGLTKATLGSSANLKVGQQVVAVGSPLGLSATVTSGIVSALNRPVRTSSEESQSPGQSNSSAQDTVLNAIQTDAAINPGNSGGALVDMNGRVIGINSAIASLSNSSSSSQSGSIGVGFAIPIDQAHRIAQEIINTGHATHAVLGATVGDAPDGNSQNAQAAAAAGLSVGAKISTVTSGGAAAAAGLQAGDVITKVGSAVVDSADALIATIRSQVPNSKVQVTYLRGTATMTATVTLGSAVSN